jgi:hypothetical protein
MLSEKIHLVLDQIKKLEAKNILKWLIIIWVELALNDI